MGIINENENINSMVMGVNNENEIIGLENNDSNDENIEDIDLLSYFDSSEEKHNVFDAVGSTS